jgi:hypothetical protein
VIFVGLVRMWGVGNFVFPFTYRNLYLASILNRSASRYDLVLDAEIRKVIVFIK